MPTKKIGNLLSVHIDDDLLSLVERMAEDRQVERLRIHCSVLGVPLCRSKKDRNKHHRKGWDNPRIDD
jgi:hypothetical protein